MSEIVERLTLIEPDWSDVERRGRQLRKQGVVRRAVVTAGVVAATAALAAGAYAAAHTIWSGRDMSAADIARQETTVSNDTWGECDGHGHCKTVTGTHKEVTMLPSMGIVFVFPDGDSIPVTPGFAGIWNIPAAGTAAPPEHPMLDDSGKSWGTAHPLRDSSGNWVGGVWTVPIPGGERTITWHQGSGTMTVADSIGGQTTTTALHAGDVVPLIPGTLDNRPRTLDKAVIFDLPPGERVIIFPRLNETYIDFVQGPLQSEPLAAGEAAKYGLTPVGKYDGKLPVTADGGTWTAHLPGGLTRTVTWHAGDSFVTVEDTTASGTTTTQVPIGHELPLVPFR